MATTNQKPQDAADLDIGYDFEILKTTRRAAGSGTWVIGRIAGYRFDALVFPEHAENPEWELCDSRISKLWLSRIANKETSFNWDRGLDIPAVSENAQAVVDFLANNLATHIYIE